MKDSNLRSFRDGFTVPSLYFCEQRKRLTHNNFRAHSPQTADVSRDQPDTTGRVHAPWSRITRLRSPLAWIRTALGLLAGGVAVHQLVTPFKASGARTSLAVGCLVLSIVLAVGAYSHWRSVQQAMRRDAPLPGNILVPVLAVGAGVIALLAGAAVLLT